MENIKSSHINVTQEDYEFLTPKNIDLNYLKEKSQSIEHSQVITDKDESLPLSKLDCMMVSNMSSILPSQNMMLIESKMPSVSTEVITERQLLQQSSKNDNNYNITFATRSNQFRYGSSEPRSLDRLPRKKLSCPIGYYENMSETSSSLQSNLSGYTSGYLEKARKFGTVITGLRKPGHHIGPVKNPDCQCEYCCRWMIERSERLGRGKTLSMSDAF